MRDKPLKDWLFYLENQHIEEIQLGLTRIKEVALRLDLLQWTAKIIVVAGTNGKGSTVASLEKIYRSSGYRVGSYTSPHLLTFNERIKVDGQPISDQKLCSLFWIIEQTRSDITLTYFEMTTLAALLYFKSFDLDIILLEVGLGGRQDATNILEHHLSIITTVHLDHQAYLGETVEAIGYEKAGILRPHQPFIYADFNPPQSVLKEASALKVSLFQLGVDYSFSETKDEVRFMHEGLDLIFPRPNINLKAFAAAWMATLCLHSSLPISYEKVRSEISELTLPGRQHVIDGDIKTIFDVAHNPQAVQLLSDFVESMPRNGRVLAIFSGLADKDLRAMIQPMKKWVDLWYPTLLSGKRAASETTLMSAFQTERCHTEKCSNDPWSAYLAVLKKIKPGDMVIVYGSFLLVSAILPRLEELS